MNCSMVVGLLCLLACCSIPIAEPTAYPAVAALFWTSVSHSISDANDRPTGIVCGAGGSRFDISRVSNRYAVSTCKAVSNNLHRLKNPVARCLQVKAHCINHLLSIFGTPTMAAFELRIGVLFVSFVVLHQMGSRMFSDASRKDDVVERRWVAHPK